jgi:hypothetical protein
MDPVLVELDDFILRNNGQVERLSPLIARLLSRLDESPTLAQAWQPLETEMLCSELPLGIVSAWLFALRGGGRFPSERQPNSWQRSFALQGRALFEIALDGSWQQHQLDGEGQTTRERAISIPPDMWHRIAIGPAPFVSLSFHTVAAAELIEETCEGDDFTQTQRRLYHG